MNATRAARRPRLRDEGERSGARLFVERHGPTAIKFLLTLAASAFVAYGAAQRKAGAVEARDEARLAGVEQSVETLKRESVPRAESAARWDAQDKALGEIRDDLRDVRTTTTAILFKLSGPTK